MATATPIPSTNIARGCAKRRSAQSKATTRGGRIRRSSSRRSEGGSRRSYSEVPRQERDPAFAPEGVFGGEDLLLGLIGGAEHPVNLAHLVEALNARLDRKDVVPLP